MATGKAHRFPISWGFGIVAATASLAVCGWFLGRGFAPVAARPQAPAPRVQTFRVAGGSLVPTLFGPTLRTNCVNCRREILFDPQSLSGGPGDLVCSLCGNRHDLSEPQFANSLTTYLGDVVQSQAVPTDRLHIGDLIAINHDGQLHVKRIAGLAGDEIDVAGSRLLVNGQRLEDRIASDAVAVAPPILIDDDSRRTTSRWSTADTHLGWIRDSQRRWSAHSNSPWLVYHHFNVHDHQLPSGVLDDYQFNAGIARQLNRVDRLSVSGALADYGGAALQVAFWSTAANVLAEQPLVRDAEFEVSYTDGQAAEHLPVSREQPIAIRLLGGGATIEKLTVRRNVEYRLNRRHDRQPYPLRLPGGACFVVGDNVPVSVDSRTWGPIDTDQIVGRVRVVESIHDHRSTTVKSHASH